MSAEEKSWYTSEIVCKHGGAKLELSKNLAMWEIKPSLDTETDVFQDAWIETSVEVVKTLED